MTILLKNWLSMNVLWYLMSRAAHILTNTSYMNTHGTKSVGTQWFMVSSTVLSFALSCFAMVSCDGSYVYSSVKPPTHDVGVVPVAMNQRPPWLSIAPTFVKSSGNCACSM